MIKTTRVVKGRTLLGAGITTENMEINKRLAEAGDLYELIQVISAGRSSFNIVNLASAFHQLAKQFKAMNKDKLVAVRSKIINIVHLLTKDLRTQINESDPQMLADVAWAHAAFGIKDKALFIALAREAEKEIKLDKFKPQDFANLTWAYATLGIKPGTLFNVLASEAKKKLNTFDPYSLTNMAWAFVVAECFNVELFSSLGVAVKERADDFSDAGLRQLSHVEMSLLYEAPDLRFELPAKIKFKIQRLFDQASRKRPSPSYFHREVFGYLPNEFEMEVFVAGFFIDCAWKEKMIAVECDGDKFHNIQSTGESFGRDRLRDRLLKKMGWTIIRIKQSEWTRLKDTEERQGFIYRCLADC